MHFPKTLGNFGAACTSACCAYLHLSAALACRCRQCIFMLASFQFIDFDDARELHSFITYNIRYRHIFCMLACRCSTAISCKIHHSIVFHCLSIIYIYVQRSFIFWCVTYEHFEHSTPRRSVKPKDINEISQFLSIDARSPDRPNRLTDQRIW